MSGIFATSVASVALDDETIKKVETKAAAIAKCIEILALRIRFNNALIVYMQRATPLEYVQFMREHRRILVDPEKVALSKQEQLIGAQDDLNLLIELKGHLDALAKNPNDMLSSLTLAQRLQRQIAFDATNFSANIEAAGSRLHAARAELAAANRGKNRSIIARAEHKLEQAQKAKSFAESMATDEYYEHHAYLQLKKIIWSDILTPIEIEYVDKFIMIQFVKNADGSHNYLVTYSPEFVVFYNEKMSQINATNNKIMNMLQSDADVKDPGNADLVDEVTYMMTSRVEMGDPVRLVEKFISLLKSSERMQQLDADADELLHYESQSLAEKQRMLLERNASQAEQEALIRSERKTELLRRRAEREADKLKREVAKRVRHKLTINTNVNTASVGDQARLVSAFKVPLEAVRANIDLLLELFDCNTTKIRYSRVEAIIRPFGGKLVKDTASSHQYVEFNEQRYQQLAIKDDEEDDAPQVTATTTDTVKAGLARPHEPFLSNHNLILLIDAVESIMPEGWREVLAAEKRAGVRLKSTAA